MKIDDVIHVALLETAKKFAALESQRDAALAEADRYRRLWAAGVRDRQREPGTPDDLDALARRMDRARAERDVLAKAKAWRDARRGPWASGADVEFHLFAAVDALLAAETAEQETTDA